MALTLLTLLVAVPTLWLSTQAYPSLLNAPIWQSYLQQPIILLVNFLPPLALVWIFTLLWNRPWAGYLSMTLVSLALSLGNYFKISLRGDPVTLYDLTLLDDAAKIAGEYSLNFTPAVWIVLICALAGQVAVAVLLPTGLELGWRRRLVALVGSVALSALLFVAVYGSETVYQWTCNEKHISRWSATEVYLSRGLWYPFLSSGVDRSADVAASYTGDIQALLELRSQGKTAETVEIGALSQDLGPTPIRQIDIIPKEARQVESDREISVVSIMLEAFCDLTDYPLLAQYEGVQEAYEIWRQMEAESIYGDLTTNSFGGGTSNTEWSFLTGLPDYSSFDHTTESYVWYLRSLGYNTQGSHPGYCDFYNRVEINHHLGFQTYRFAENYYGDYIDPAAAFWRSDNYLVDGILDDVEGAFSQGEEVFSFSVSYQNHGPYSVAEDMETPYIPEDSGLTLETRGIIQTYLQGIVHTLEEMERLRQELDAMPEPVVLVLFGDHKPWLGNDYSCYREVEVSFDQSTVDGVFNYFNTPYLIWANQAAQDKLGYVESGESDTISPCFLMNKVFQYCQWEEPAAMDISSEMMEVTPVILQTGRYLYQGEFVEQLESPYDMQLAEYFALHQYRREQVYTP